MNNTNNTPYPEDYYLPSKDMSKAKKLDNDNYEINRKKKISENILGYEVFHHLHQYSKNKIHCSCPLCRAKTQRKMDYMGGSKHRQGGKNLSIKDRKSFDDMNIKEREYTHEETNCD